jgi:hypothetical protein
VEWERRNDGHRDGTRLQLEVTETTKGEFAASVVQSDMEPGHLGEGAHALQRALVRLREHEETDFCDTEG